MKTARQLSIAILLFLCGSALYGSYQMITDPTGNSLGLPFYLLNGTILSSYAVVGWILLFTVGVFCPVIILFILLRSDVYSFLIMFEGVILCIFIFVQMFLLWATFWVQYVYLVTGFALIILGALQNQWTIAVEAERKGRDLKER
jgi:hypothetical protein